MWSIFGVAFVVLLMKLSNLYVNFPYLPCRDVWQRSEKVGNFKFKCSSIRDLSMWLNSAKFNLARLLENNI